MNNHDFNIATVADGIEIDLYTAIPDGQGLFPGLIVIQEAFGITSHIRNVCERFCEAGYAVVSPDLFHRTGKRLEIAYNDFPSAMPHMQALTKDGLVSDLQASFQWLIALQTVSKDKIGSVGYCLGGRVSFLANAVLPLSACVSYYGGGLDQLAGEAVNLHAPHLFFWGGKDDHIKQESIDTIINAVKAAGREYTTVTISEAAHGFNCDDRQSYNPSASREAWAHTLAFFDDRLK